MAKVMMPSLLALMCVYTKRSWVLMSTTFMVSTLFALHNYPLFLSVSPSMGQHLDSVNTGLIMLTTWVLSLMLLASQSIKLNNLEPAKFMMTCSALLFSLMLAFTSNNLMTFYVMFEASLIPTFALVLGWGGQPERLQAGTYLIMYTVTGSLPLLVSLMTMSMNNATLYMGFMMCTNTGSSISMVAMWLMTSMAFMVKMPLYSVHLWLPKAHVEAPVSGSMILAAILLKLGAYGLLRVSCMFQGFNSLMKPYIMALSLIGAVYTSLICLRQTDLKALIAYSSVSHMGLLISAMMTHTAWSTQGVMFMMVAHGLTSSALFSACNMVYETTHTRSLYLTKGLLAMFPTMSLLWFVLTLCNMAGPPSMNLASEICLFVPPMSSSSMLAIPLVLTGLLSGAYSLHLYTSTNHGNPSPISNPTMQASAQMYITCVLHAGPSLLLFMKMDLITPML